MLRTYKLFRLFLTLSVLTYSSEGFSVESRRSNELTKSARRGSQFQHGKPLRQLSKTALEQASVAPSYDDQPRKRILEGIRSKLPQLRAGAKAEGSLLERHPFLSAVMITTVNALAADVLTQLVFEKAVWNAKRSFLFAAFGFLYQGIAQYAIVNWGWERLFPGTKPTAVIAKICGMNLLSDPILFMPTFYIFKEFMVSGSLSWGMVKAALLGYKANALMDWRNSWMVWFPGHAVTYGVMPSHKRIPWMAFLSFFYMCVLSLTRGGA